MSTEKLSISLENDLAAEIRGAAEDAGRSVSGWLADAAEQALRSRRLQAALDAWEEEHGAMDEEEMHRLVAEARKKSILVNPYAPGDRRSA